ncbi:Hypothetical predicted protein [Olea europaea subsp. europaea]|uniref:Uncharacterized protein n=1 Tax=Olea europaea subsp. europaea TaxID=158383 RepID=A0A8S0RNG6_OLEEU|nr:Hypothetical predicted protein [Olea europaea subsp. europaea]
MKSKKRKSVPAIEGTAMLDIEMESDHSADKCSDRIEVGCAPLNIQQPACCQREIDASGIF